MKYLLIIIFLCKSLYANTQEVIALDNVKNEDTVKDGQAIIYGNFIQRLGFSSGGYPQDIRLINLVTKEILSFRVKPTFKSAKENAFIYFIKSGNYAILNYWWTQSKWYGGKMYTEEIYKNIDASDGLEQKIKSGQINPAELKQFSFVITEKSINYLGSWHFDKGIVSFSDDKEKHDNSVRSRYTNISLAELITICSK
jgi:hypothetical protein